MALVPVEFLVQTLVIVVYLLTLGVLALFGTHRSALLIRYLRHRGQPARPSRRFAEVDLPHVTVQLPMFNEMFVAKRLIEAAGRIDYPADRLEVQVLDDSTDGTSAIARAACDALRRQGREVVYLHRELRKGYKAGALEEGLRRAKGELVFVLDADFLPEPSIVRELVHFFTDPSVGMVQARWGHLNREHSMLTRSQAMFLDGHFVIEHTARHRSGRFFNFNGTAGMWRVTAIVDAGGWQHDTVTEDMDLSYRAQLAGWRFIYAPQIRVCAELPCEMTSFRSQQHRWAKGSLQTARKLLGSIARASVSKEIKTEAFFHLGNNLAYLFLLLLALLQLPNMFIRRQMEHPELLLLDVPLFLATCGSVVAFYLVAERELGESPWRTLARLPFMMALGIGLAVNNGRAAIEGLFGGDVDFVRTPKRGVVDGSSITGAPRYHGRWSWQVVVELGFGLYCTGTLILAVITRSWASLPFVLLFASGFLYVGLGSLLEALRVAARQGESAAGAQAPSTHSSPRPQSMLS